MSDLKSDLNKPQEIPEIPKEADTDTDTDIWHNVDEDPSNVNPTQEPDKQPSGQGDGTTGTVPETSYTNFVALAGMYTQGSDVKNNRFNANLEKYKCVLGENLNVTNKEFKGEDAKYKVITHNNDKVTDANDGLEFMNFVKSVFSDNLTRDVLNSKKSNTLGNVKLVAMYKATVQLVFGYEKDGEGRIQAKGEMQIVSSGVNVMNKSIDRTPFEIKDNVITKISLNAKPIVDILKEITGNGNITIEDADGSNTTTSNSTNGNQSGGRHYSRRRNRKSRKLTKGRKNRSNKKIKRKTKSKRKK